MNVIPKGTNFNFIFWPLLKVLGVMIVAAGIAAILFRLVFSWLPKGIYNKLFNVVLIFSALAGFYFGLKIFGF